MEDIQELNKIAVDRKKRELFAFILDPNLYLLIVFAVMLALAMLNSCSHAGGGYPPAFSGTTSRRF